ncbi:phosphoribosylformylglycinamidine cyclo-ligase [Secundilactobacillus kimchicus]|uniref:Phosphoribosylformylglycinamidine cyclo-ligase n=1 Tax=Secundilactobacillus kimchicus JCM 15530 TaxID=1302272 RepID=A0A0R1HQH8_9LACO|nr:phosphoribosylformylglycinamidine cyclo-ligase [Secundilactobacillus kimchicus]KRK49101.1 phosphoribosylformylglycinamidine cyclo-ligase [Secundilactobacillus kimchicus JCM 15530]
MKHGYEEAGVNIAAGEQAVSEIKEMVKTTHDHNVLAGIGGFGAEYALTDVLAGVPEPVLVSGTDGVGTKLRIAIEMQKHDTIGIDLVAMCANDILTQGARPLFFLDYLGVGQLKPATVKQIVAGIADGCRQSHLSLIGGEMAEMPGIYQGADYDLSGFAVGLVSRRRRLTAERVQADDVVVGLPSNGVHSNGFSLVRHIVETAQLDLHQTYPGFDQPLGLELLTPTKLYYQAVYPLIEAGIVQAAAHITGGGLAGNLARSIPAGLTAVIDRQAWQVPTIFSLLQRAGKIDDDEMRQVFNLGIGMALIVRPEAVQTVLNRVPNAVVIGKIKKRGETAVELR